MPTSDPTEILLQHQRWSTRNLLDACAALSHDDFHRRFEMGPGSLHDTVTHILGAIRGWGDLLAGRDQRERLEAGPERTIDELRAIFEGDADDFERSVRTHPREEVLTAERGGRSYSFTRGTILTHVTTHGMHHRAQCLNMLRHVGVDPLPPAAVVEWSFAADA